MTRAIRFCITATALTISAITGNAAVAGTSAYVTSGTLTKTVDQCLKDMKSTAEKTGFTVAQETLFDKNGMAGISTLTKRGHHSISQEDAIR